LHGVHVTYTPGIRTAEDRRARQKVATPYQGVHQGTSPYQHTFILKSTKTSTAVDVTYGRLGCTIAHALAMEAFLNDGGESPYALIIEDDIDFDLIPYWPVTLAEYVAGAPKDWEILHLQCGTRVVRGMCGIRYSDSEAGGSGTFLYCISRAGAKRFWDKHTNKGDGPFRFLSDPATYPCSIVADWYLYNVLRTYCNAEFPGITFSDGTSNLDNTAGGLRMSVKLAGELAKSLLDTIIALLPPGDTTISVIAWLPGAPTVWARTTLSAAAWGMVQTDWTFAPFRITRVPPVASTNPKQPLAIAPHTPKRVPAHSSGRPLRRVVQQPAGSRRNHSPPAALAPNPRSGRAVPRPVNFQSRMTVFGRRRAR
jgi:hypothetical protein